MIKSKRQTRRVLFVTYGGGHAQMIIPLARALLANPDYEVEVIALTTAGRDFARAGLPYRGMRDFLKPGDEEALRKGQQLAASDPQSRARVPEAESIAYLGLCYHDLAQRAGETEAARLWQTCGRQAFLPVDLFGRILGELRPDLVVATNSPRGEQAALLAARRRGIRTLALVDLFGIHHFHSIVADTICVLSERTRDRMCWDNPAVPPKAFVVTGNPAFDAALSERGSIDYAWRRAQLPSIDEKSPWILYADSPASLQSVPEQRVVQRDEAERLSDLADVAAAAKQNGAHLLVRPHPSLSPEPYQAWIARHPDMPVTLASMWSLHSVIRASDAVVIHSSTVGVEALLMERPVVQLRYRCCCDDIPLADWGAAIGVRSRADMANGLSAALRNGEDALRRAVAARALLPQAMATPRVVAAIDKLLAGLNDADHRER